MAFQVKPFKEVLALSKEKLDEALAPIRAKSAKAKAQLEISKLEEQLVDLENKIHSACAEKELNFVKIVDLMDEYALAERRAEQIRELVNSLFPAEG